MSSRSSKTSPSRNPARPTRAERKNPTDPHHGRRLADLVHARGENAVLRERVQRLEQELDRLSEVEPENARLRQLLDFRQTLQGELLTARVIGRDATGLARTLTIDRGESAGVARGAAALAPAGVVGQVFLVSRHAARVLLVTDHNSA